MYYAATGSIRSLTLHHAYRDTDGALRLNCQVTDTRMSLNPALPPDSKENDGEVKPKG